MTDFKNNKYSIEVGPIVREKPRSNRCESCGSTRNTVRISGIVLCKKCRDRWAKNETH